MKLRAFPQRFPWGPARGGLAARCNRAAAARGAKPCSTPISLTSRTLRP